MKSWQPTPPPGIFPYASTESLASRQGFLFFTIRTWGGVTCKSSHARKGTSEQYPHALGTVPTLHARVVLLYRCFAIVQYQRRCLDIPSVSFQYRRCNNVAKCMCVNPITLPKVHARQRKKSAGELHKWPMTSLRWLLVLATLHPLFAFNFPTSRYEYQI